MKEIALHKDIKVILSNRIGGVSKKPYESLNLGLHVNDNPLHVQKNRDIFASFIGAEADKLCFMEQVHSNKVIHVKEKGEFTCDGIITQNKNLVLCVMVADCVPVVLFDAKNRAAAAIHAGRKGAFADIAANTINAMRKNFGTEAKDISAFIGASIKACCYEINGDALKEAMDKFAFAVKKRGGGYFLDLQKIIKKQLMTNGVAQTIEDDICTCCDNDYFSYRRDGVTGRFAVGVRITG